MNKYSKICKIIDERPDDWKEFLSKKEIRIKFDENSNLAIFNYGITADFYDEVVKEARGIIIDIKTKEVVARGFDKFGNSHEGYVDTIDWNTARVQEKVDGSIIKLFYNGENKNDSVGPVLCGWQFATNSCIDAKEASLPNSKHNYLWLLQQTQEYKDILGMVLEGRLDRDNTYIFELVSPENQIVIKYDKPMLYHLGTRSNITGQEFEIDLGIQKPKQYALQSLDDCIEAAIELNKHSTDGFPIAEGFVVVDKDYHRIKVKSPEYLVWHHKINNGILRGDIVYDLLREDDFNEITFEQNACKYVFENYKKYKKQVIEILYKIKVLMGQVRELNKQGYTRKDIALAIKDNPYQVFGFSALDNLEASPEDIFSEYDTLLHKIFKKIEI